MTSPLNVNRYGKVTPSSTQTNGVCISTVVYIALTNDTAKLLLNSFRTVRSQQLAEMGYNDLHTTQGGLIVATNDVPPQTPIEKEMGMDEQALRMVLFQRSGIAESLILKLQNLTGVEVVTRQQIEETFSQWIDHQYSTDEHKGTKTTTTRTTKTTKTRKVPATSS